MTHVDKAAQGQPARRREIVEAARDLAAEKGWAGVTVRAIAARIGCSAPAIYQYFADKDAVLAIIAAEGRDALAVSLESALADVTGPAKRLRALVRALWDFAQSHRELYSVMFGLNGMAGFATGEPLAPEPLRRVAAELAAKREAPEAAENLAERIAATAHGFISLHLSGAGLDDRERSAALLMQTVEDVMKGLGRR